MRRPAVVLSLAFLAFAAPVAARDLASAIGERLFQRAWVGAPASTKATDGLGPLYNARSCAGCHGSDGSGGDARILRLQSKDGLPDPLYGLQIQDKALAGLTPEGTVDFVETTAGDRPVVHASVKLSGPPIDRRTVMTVRLAPDLAAVGRIAQASDAAILAQADPDDRNGDGVSGRPNMVKTDGQPMVGRFGWRATGTSLDRQIEAAFAIDLGMSTKDMPRPAGDCTALQIACRSAPNGRDGGGEEIAPEIVAALRDFLLNKQPAPAARQQEPHNLFVQLGCAACHVPQLAATQGGKVTIFSDLLLHDMGSGLSDGTRDGDAVAGEWRTAPLVGLGRPGRRLLHDGRASSADQAIRWHDGEALAARQRYETLDASLRQSLLNYLNGL
jgi:CxxC motif-containing protein (DUF1111 family)